MRLATWNVNSIRSRIDRVTGWLERADVDVLAMQETKCTDEQFPTMPFAALGYEVAHVGHNQWNGVAIASRVGLDDVQLGFDGQPAFNDVDEARAIGATCGGVRVWSLYVPNGRTVQDPHYAYKLEWLAALRNTATGWRDTDPAAPIALVGDWNIAPTDDDVWDMAVFTHSTHVTAPERAAFRAIEERFADVVRPFTPGPGVYTYWDYTQLRFPKRQGMRIDFILGSPALEARVTHGEIARDERKPGKKGTPAPSDHAPVFVDL
ncbi:exodeoxyribonuclease III [Mycolicibacterium madagascariense]|uniref:Exodeoxyribonuclease III n=1 Tax=Mycolicibacterium madagascariense TaxID=212765 RepID=A0A7I7XC34_9MYCO|nr:exodeoxyribonuclease III [Mycolicibacterium madagascariense]MCV7014773.1 exodeoxyribonuclease III [Mycolicibacterium madagascariense]BBZ26483.1 exodeoxyribonuclease III [Mycolicibacterium madagascariense]